MTRRVRGVLCRTAVLCLTATLTATGAPASAAPARGGTAPVTAPDAVTTYPGNLTTLRPLHNDSDAEGDRLTICALGPEKYVGIRIDVFEDLKDYYVEARAKAAPGTYTFTYFACDGTSSTPGTVTLTIAEPPRIIVRKLAGRPGQLRVTNRAPFRIRFLYGDYTKDDAEGDLKIARNSSVVITTRYTRIDWFAFAARSGATLRKGHVEGVRRPRVP